MNIISILFRIILLSLLCMVGLVSCSYIEGLSKHGDLIKELPGQWYYSENNRICCVAFSENGTGTITCHTYSEKQWNEFLLSFQYTLSDNMLTLKPTEEEIMRGTVGIVENSLSFNNADITVMFTRYDGSERFIDELKSDIEDNWSEQEPPIVAPGIDVEEEVVALIMGIYNELKIYEYSQMLLEKIRITGQDFHGHLMPKIMSKDYNVSNAWEQAYKMIGNTNLLIAVLEDIDVHGRTMDEHRRVAYMNEAKVLRSLVYYNIAMLWGNVPYITIYNPDIDEYRKTPVLSSEELYIELDNILQGIYILPENGVDRVTMETVKSLRGEIALSLGNKKEAEYLLCDCRSDFSVLIDSQDDSDMYQIFGEVIPNYTSDKIELLLQEARMQSNDDVSSLKDEWVNRKQYWGYWGMLKRIGQAQAVSGCEKYELLMPIPYKELSCGLVKQNPGY